MASTSQSFCLYELTGNCASADRQLFRHQTVLAVPQDEGQKGENESIQDAHDGQDVGPAHRAGPQRVLVRLLATHPLHLVAVPAVRTLSGVTLRHSVCMPAHRRKPKISLSTSHGNNRVSVTVDDREGEGGAKKTNTD
ncbi:hypothetical protein FQN60_005813 [Etheostoma spectabile]|uniref:Uncharacterized protein n=1 Tax=Etheostoma spectabile TaxID=54343 RepID=A0A5J5CFA2_9PERO|nr:hypothetical protein FQN60_005813 [Etheostoma spectabile]